MKQTSIGFIKDFVDDYPVLFTIIFIAIILGTTEITVSLIKRR